MAPTMKIAQIMKGDVEVCAPDDNLAAAASRMWDCDIGCLPVLDTEGHVIGMITDRDVCMAALTRGQRLDEIPVSVAMSKEVLSCGPEAALVEAEEIMRSGQVRRLPVIDSAACLVGLVSLNDLARLAEREKEVGAGIRVHRGLERGLGLPHLERLGRGDRVLAGDAEKIADHRHVRVEHLGRRRRAAGADRVHRFGRLNRGGGRSRGRGWRRGRRLERRQGGFQFRDPFLELVDLPLQYGGRLRVLCGGRQRGRRPQYGESGEDERDSHDSMLCEDAPIVRLKAVNATARVEREPWSRLKAQGSGLMAHAKGGVLQERGAASNRGRPEVLSSRLSAPGAPATDEKRRGAAFPGGRA